MRSFNYVIKIISFMAVNDDTSIPKPPPMNAKAPPRSAMPSRSDRVKAAAPYHIINEDVPPPPEMNVKPPKGPPPPEATIAGREQEWGTKGNSSKSMADKIKGLFTKKKSSKAPAPNAKGPSQSQGRGV